ncbi:nucleotidyltransferase [Candidatus Micrarchaeota archaeon CG08_land_8_20_14_0_20_49_17]|nr:MAG: hypothetical protein AUJ13_00485 [Candidatus Micrarchaeota archaeon CG1_02_49_24]PIU10074.1 MAG: nucleotidyltransferase [Candidatus Micrarchaeota archaeon CG08_land_8_20_14_0_20_49_17]PIU81120.1 MAG: nucleotidyltransferase [Candidatus Micrarchaeota archaeon CG06_land_8_20_14_3_00_50_6]PIZ93316.1 MAG: nucleotidyltransferase [Candidatus Micrarchaeota archaeon CG_4_10_14_0_2_um_filter_49_7]
MNKATVAGLKEFKKKVETRFPLDILIFFGSRTRKTQRKDSDIDLILVSEKFKGLNFFQRVARMYDFWRLRCPVDFICYTPEEFKEFKQGATMVSEALKTGIVI